MTDWTPSEDTIRAMDPGGLERKDAEIARLQADRAIVYAWMREPDWTEEASLSWVMDWINRRPITQCHVEPLNNGEDVRK